MSHWRQLFISKYSVASILDCIWALMAAFPREALLSVIKFQNGWWIKGSFLVGQMGREQFHDRHIPEYLQVCIRQRTILGDCGKGGDQLMCPSVSYRMEVEDTQFHSLKVLNKVYIPVKATDTRVWMGHCRQILGFFFFFVFAETLAPPLQLLLRGKSMLLRGFQYSGGQLFWRRPYHG